MAGPLPASPTLPASPAPASSAPLAATTSSDAPDTPLPKPASQNWSDYLYQAAASAAPGASPAVVAAAAKSSSTPEDAADNAMAAGQYSKVTAQADSLKSRSIQDQQDFWKGASAAEQSQLEKARYTPPAPPHSSGIFGSVTGALKDVADDAGKIASDVTSNRAVHDTLNVLGAPLRAEQHVERTIEVAANPMGTLQSAFQTNADLHSFFSVKEWARAWDETSNGTKYIMPVVRNQVQQQFGKKVFQIADQLATGVSPQQILNAAPANQRQDLENYLQVNNAQISAATSQLNNGKLSIGRWVAGSDLMNSHPDLGKALSGGIDATMGWFGDPTTIGTKAIATARAAQFLIRTPQDVDNIFNGARTATAANRWADKALEFINGTNNGGRVDMEGFRNFAPKYQSIGTYLNTTRQTLGRDLNVEDLKDMFKTNVVTKSLLTNNALEAPGLYRGGAVLPHLSIVGEAKAAVKSQLLQAANWAETAGIHVDPDDVTSPITSTFNPASRLVHGGGQLFKRFTTLVPSATDELYHYDPANPNVVGHLNDIFKMLLPSQRAADLVNDFFDATDTAGRRDVYLNAMKEMGLAAGYTDGTPEMRKWMQRFSSEVEGDEQGGGAVDERSYSHANNDEMPRDNGAGKYAVGVTKSQMAGETYPIPDFRTAYLQAKKSLTMSAYNMAFNNQFENWAMAGWRAATLAHFGFGLRVAADEGVLGMLRIGPERYLRGLVNTAYGSAISHWSPEFIDALQEGRSYERWLGDMDPDTLQYLRDQDRTFNDNDLAMRRLATEHSLSIYKRAFANVATRTAFESIIRYFPDLVKYSNYSLPRKISMIEEGFDGPMAGKRLEDIDPRTGKRVAIEFTPSGKYTNYNPEVGKQYQYAYQRALGEIHYDPWARPALESRNLDKTDRLNAIADTLQSDPDWRELAIRSNKNRAGQLVDDGTITERQAALDHAEVLDNHVRHLITSPRTGEFNEDLVKVLQRSGPITMPLVESIPPEDLPSSVSGPEMVQVMDLSDTPKYFQRANNWFFRKVIGPQVDGLVRQPLYWDAYVSSRESIQPWVDDQIARGKISSTNADAIAHDVAVDRSIRQITPYVHNPELKSQFSVITRNLAPFWFAQEQMYKRWMRSLSFAPWSVRQMQLMYGGLTTSGFVTTDPETGQKVFMYPALPAVTRVLTDALSHVGVHVSTHLSTEWAGQLTGLTPALQDSFNLPNGPLLALPLHELGVLDPHLSNFTNSLDNGYGDQSGFSQVMPTDLDRIFQTVWPDTFDASTYASMQMSAIKYLEASGQGMGTTASNYLGTTTVAGPPTPQHQNMPANPQPGDYYTDSGGTDYVYQPDGTWRADTPAEMQNYIERIKNTTRTLIALKGVFGFFTPASPTPEINPQLSNQLTSLLNQTDGSNPPVTYDQAITSYLAANPNASPYTVATTETSDPSAYLPATKGTQQWLENNSSFVNEHPDAALYFIPTSATKGNFSQTAYDDQMKQKFRTQQTPSNFYNKVIYDEAATIYYNTEDQKNALIAQGQDKTTVDQVWDNWSGQFLQANPIFASSLETSSGVNNRNNIMTAVGNALNDTDRATGAPISQTTADIKTLYNSWLEWQNAIGNGASDGSYVSSELVDQYNDIFATWASNFANAHPDVQSLYNAAVRPATSTTLTEMAQAQQSQGGAAIASGAVPGATATGTAPTPAPSNQQDTGVNS